MIIPVLSSNTALNEERIRDWSLFGQLALRSISSTQIDELESMIKRVGGAVDLHIELSDPNQTDVLRLLNAGASSILIDADQTESLSEVPFERLRHIFVDDGQDSAIPSHHFVALNSPTADRLAELEMARIDCLVDVDFLESHSDVIGDFFSAVLVSDRPDGLWSTVIVDPLGVALGLAYSDAESLSHAIEHRVGAYHSRSRDGLWVKGETSGATQQLLGIRFDCDRDCLRFRVTQQAPGFCHRDTYTCFGQQRTIQTVMHRLIERMQDSDEKSFTRKLANDAVMLETKLLEEAKELSDASQTDDQYEIAWEAADVLYFSLIAMLKNGVKLDRVYEELGRRMNRVVRRKNKLETQDEN